MRLVYLFFCAVGLSFLALTIQAYDAAAPTWNWVETEGDLFDAEVSWEYVPSQSDEGSWDIDFELSYAYSTLADQEPVQHFRSKRFDVFTGKSAYQWRVLGRWAMLHYARRTEPKVKVYYDPQNPKQSVLWQGIPFEAVSYSVLATVFLFTSVSFLLPGSTQLGSRRGENKKEAREGERFVLVLIVYLFFALPFIAAIYTLTPIFTKIGTPETLLLLFPALSILLYTGNQTKPGNPQVAAYPAIYKTAVASICAVFLLSIVGIAREIVLARGDRLAAYDYDAKELAELLRSDNTHVLSWAGYKLSRLKERSVAARPLLLKNISHKDPNVQKASLHALDQYHNLTADELRIVYAELPAADEDRALSIAFFLGKRHGLPTAEVLPIAAQLLNGSKKQQEAAFRILFTLRADSLPLQGKVIEVLSTMEPGPAFAFGLKVLKRQDRAPLTLEPQLLRALNGKSSASQLSAMYYLQKHSDFFNDSSEELRAKIRDIHATGNKQWRQTAGDILTAAQRSPD